MRGASEHGLAEVGARARSCAQADAGVQSGAAEFRSEDGATAVVGIRRGSDAVAQGVLDVLGGTLAQLLDGDDELSQKAGGRG